MRTRIEKSANYRSVFFAGKTLRMPIDSTKPITELKHPEFYDISLGNKCVTGRCSWCYASGNPKGTHYHNVAKKLQHYFGCMPLNDRPYQVAIGGEQEPLEHPEFADVLETFVNMDIVPNYTTNGVLFDGNAVELTHLFCGGVAITAHPHLTKYWTAALELAKKHNLRVNLHVIVSDDESLELLSQAYNRYNGMVDYFVLLPYMNVGYAAKSPRMIDYVWLEHWLDTVAANGNIAFGSNFHKFLVDTKKWGVSLYPPEIMSKYLVCDDNMSLYNNSFEKKPVK